MSVDSQKVSQAMWHKQSSDVIFQHVVHFSLEESVLLQMLTDDLSSQKIQIYQRIERIERIHTLLTKTCMSVQATPSFNSFKTAF